MYPNKFPSKTPFNYKRLNEKEIIQFNQQIIIESEWVIDHSGICIRSVNCEKKTYRELCSPCFYIHFNSSFLNRIQAAVPDPKNIKFTPKFYFNNNPLLTYLKNVNIKQLNELLGADNSSYEGF
ncbi:hypothetical protein C1646_768566 [Rhizophagus diaphanus]|nr:hypothetical protein C1646_768566 [Rhizophagus diaphanus] [Rhizophagus sp. MUCL 43196]